MINIFFTKLNRKKFSFNYETVIFIASVTWFLSLFLLFVLTKFFNKDLFPFFNTSLSFSDATSWLPLVADISRGNLFPLTPSVGMSENGLSYLPYLTLWIYGFLISLLGTELAFFFSSVVFPTLSFILMIKVYKNYLSVGWSITLSALGMVNFSYLPLREFLLASLNGEGWKSIINGTPPDIISVPFPSLSLMIFLLALYLTINTKIKFSIIRITFLTIIWTSQFYIYTINGLLGVPFWFSILLIKLWQHKNTNKIKSISYIFLLQVGLSLIICIPLIVGYLNNFSFEIALNSGIISLSNEPNHSVDTYYFIVYFFIPISLLTIVYLFQRIDLYEIIVRFFPIFLLMIIELCLILLKINTGFGLQPELIFDRIGTFFLHLFYYVPTLYFLSRPAVPYSLGIEAKPIAMEIRKKLHWLFSEMSFFYLPIVFIFLTWKTLASFTIFNNLAEKNYENNIFVNKLLEIVSKDLKPGAVVVTSQPLLNIMIPLVGPYGTLWVGKFANKVSSDEIIERLALWAKLVGLTKKEFKSLMTEDNKFILRNNKVFNINDDEGLSGIGHWLAYSRTKFSVSIEKKMISQIIKKFDNLDLSASLKKFNVKRIAISKPLPKGLEVSKKTTFKNTVIYDLK